MAHDGITLSPTAAERVREILGAQATAASGAGLRIDVVAGGCSGHQYRLALDHPAEDDWVHEVDDVRVLVTPSALRYVRGARVEYDDAAGGFRIENPNVDYSCGCGSSFQLREEEPDAVTT